jgi:hypothetical protein
MVTVLYVVKPHDNPNSIHRYKAVEVTIYDSGQRVERDVGYSAVLRDTVERECERLNKALDHDNNA